MGHTASEENLYENVDGQLTDAISSTVRLQMS